MKNTKNNIITYTILIICSLFVLVPILWMLSTAIKTEQETVAIPIRWMPENPTGESFRRVIFDYPFLLQLKNSLIVVLGSSLVTLIFSALAGYGVTRFNFKGRKSFMSFLLVTQMFPSIMLLVPFYTILRQVSLLGTYLGLIVVYVAMMMAFATWMLTSFFRSIPTSLDEAAIIDGCSRFQVFYRVIMPLTLPGMISVFIYTLVMGWNEYMFAATYMQSVSMKTLVVGIAEFSGQYNVMWNDLMAASLFASIPLVVMFVFLQRYFISGMTAGAVK